MKEMITTPKSEFAVLHKLVEDLQTELSLQKHGHDSNTSYTPPFQDICRSNHNSLREKSIGGQTGHHGHHLSMVANSDEVISHVPEILQPLWKIVSNNISKWQYPPSSSRYSQSSPDLHGASLLSQNVPAVERKNRGD
jgi:hypothetical protein